MITGTNYWLWVKRMSASPAVLHHRRRVLERGAAVMTAMALGLPLANCAQNDALGRRQLILVDEDEVERMADLAERDVKRRYGGRSRDAAKQRALERMVSRMASVQGAPRPRRGMRAEMLADGSVNAFALANGYTGYMDGMWSFVSGDQHELASVMGHEMGHIAGRHHQERLSQQLALSIGAAIIGTVAAQARVYSPAVGAALGLGRALGGSAFSREHEYEADRLGMLYAARAGYDPAKAPVLFDRMERTLGDNPMAFIATHPSHGDRRDRMRRLLAEEPELARRSGRSA